MSSRSSATAFWRARAKMHLQKHAWAHGARQSRSANENAKMLASHFGDGCCIWPTVVQTRQHCWLSSDFMSPFTGSSVQTETCALKTWFFRLFRSRPSLRRVAMLVTFGGMLCQLFSSPEAEGTRDLHAQRADGEESGAGEQQTTRST